MTPWRRQLRPATAPGEDRNGETAAENMDAVQALRPATAPGEDRNQMRANRRSP